MGTIDTEFIWRMEAILELYAQPYERQRPVVTFDEMPYQLVREQHTPLPATPGQPLRYDYTYQRAGTCNLFMLFEPLAGWRRVEVTAQRTKPDFARQMQRLVDVHYPEATTIRVVLDNLNTHTPAALYETFAPAEARRLLRKLEFHYTPKHASWLNMVEIEWAVLSDQCLDRRISEPDQLQAEIDAWQTPRNAQHATVDWRFTTQEARTKFHRFYPSHS